MSMRVSQMAGWRKGFRGCGRGPWNAAGASNLDRGQWQGLKRDDTLHTTAVQRRGTHGGWRPTGGRTKTATLRQTIQRWWFQLFSAPAEAEGVISISFGRLGVTWHRSGYGDDFPGDGRRRVETIGARCPVPAGKGWTTPNFSDIEQWTWCSVGAHKSQRQFW